MSVPKNYITHNIRLNCFLLLTLQRQKKRLRVFRLAQHISRN